MSGTYSGMIADGAFTADIIRPTQKKSTRKVREISGRKGAALILTVAVIVLIAVLLAPTDSTSAAPSREEDCTSCHDVGADSLLTVTGLPTEYTPSATYTITIQVNDLNGPNGENGFYLTIDAGTLSDPGPNAEVNDAAASASTVDTRPRPEASWTVDWTAPASGTVNIHVYAVSATDSLTGKSAPSDDDTFLLNPSGAIPEFSSLLLPVVGILGAVLIAARASRRGI